MLMIAASRPPQTVAIAMIIMMRAEMEMWSCQGSTGRGGGGSARGGVRGGQGAPDGGDRDEYRGERGDGHVARAGGDGARGRGQREGRSACGGEAWGPDRPTPGRAGGAISSPSESGRSRLERLGHGSSD